MRTVATGLPPLTALPRFAAASIAQGGHVHGDECLLDHHHTADSHKESPPVRRGFHPLRGTARWLKEVVISFWQDLRFLLKRPAGVAERHQVHVHGPDCDHDH